MKKFKNLEDGLKNRLRSQARKTMLRVNRFFKDEEKSHLWLRVQNPMLGNISPLEMIKMGRYVKLTQFIKDCLSTNKPE